MKRALHSRGRHDAEPRGVLKPCVRSPSNAIAALRALLKGSLEYISNAVLFSELHTTAAKIEWKWSMRFDRRPTSLPIRLDSCKEQEREEVAKSFGVKAAAKKYPPAPTQAPTPTSLRYISRLDSPKSARAALLSLLRRACQPWCKRLGRISDCTTAEEMIWYVQATLKPAQRLSKETAQLALTDQLYSVRLLGKSMNSVHDTCLSETWKTPSSSSQICCG